MFLPKGFVLIWILSILMQSCLQANPPIIIEVVGPQNATDALGPYHFHVSAQGQIDRVQLFWESDTITPTVLLTRYEGDIEISNEGVVYLKRQRSGIDQTHYWDGTLQGQGSVVRFRWWMVVTGPGGDTRYPQNGSLSFNVNALEDRCDHDAECLAGQICHRSEFYCYQPPAVCQIDQHCPKDQFCDVTLGECRFSNTSCVDDNNCPRGQRCENNSCTSRCLTPCDDGFECINLACQPQRCTQNQDCPSSRPYCVRQECQNDDPNQCDTACNDNETCVGGMCIVVDDCLTQTCECATSADCPDQYFCDIAQGLCQVDLSSSLCAPCDANDDSTCGPGTTCVTEYSGCRPRCDGNQDCGQEQACVDGGCVMVNLPLSFCLSVECYTDSDCAVNQLCLDGYCIDTSVCTNRSECQPNQECIEARCQESDRCFSYEDCAINQRCVSGRCEDLPDVNTTFCNICEHDLDCENGQICLLLNGEDEVKRCYQPCIDQCASDLTCFPVISQLSLCIDEFNFTCRNNECGQDEYEPNDMIDTAYVLAEDSEVLNARTCSADEDIYRLDEQFEYTWIVSAQQGNILMKAYDRDYNLVNQWLDTSIDIVLPVGIRFVSISTDLAEEASVDYQLTSIPFFSRMCIDDELENNDTFAEAYSITLEEGYAATLCSQDEDWYRFDVNTEQEIYITIDFLESYDHEIEVSYGLGDALNTFNTLDPYLDIIGTAIPNEPFYLKLLCEDCGARVTYFLTSFSEF